MCSPATGADIEKAIRVLDELKLRKVELEAKAEVARGIANKHVKTLEEKQAEASSYSGELDVFRCSEAPLCKYCLVATADTQLPEWHEAMNAAGRTLAEERANRKAIRAKQTAVLIEAERIEAGLPVFTAGVAHSIVGMFGCWVLLPCVCVTPLQHVSTIGTVVW